MNIKLKIALGLLIAGIIMVSGLVFFRYLFINKPISMLLGRGMKNLTYTQYMDTRVFQKIKLPETAKNIDWSYYGARDTGYEFIQAHVKKEDISPERIIENVVFYNVPNLLTLENINFQMKIFSETFTSHAECKPEWWNENSMNNFKRNLLKIGEENTGVEGYHYLNGCWVFYDETHEMVRIFSWGQQHLSLFKFALNFNVHPATLENLYPKVAGKLEMDNKNYGKAIELFNKAVSFNPTDVEGYCNLADVYYLIGKTKKAIEMWEKVISINPKHDGAYCALGEIYAKKR